MAVVHRIELDADTPIPCIHGAGDHHGPDCVQFQVPPQDPQVVRDRFHAGQLRTWVGVVEGSAPRRRAWRGRVSARALAKTLAAIDCVPVGSRVLVTAHHPLIERGPRGQLLTIGGAAAMAALAERGVAAVLTGHVHDPFDLIAQTANGPLRMIGAGTLSKRIRSTPASYNEITVTADTITVRVCNSAEVPTDQMQLDAVPQNALPPREPGDPVAPIGAVPEVDPPVQ